MKEKISPFNKNIWRIVSSTNGYESEDNVRKRIHQLQSCTYTHLNKQPSNHLHEYDQIRFSNVIILHTGVPLSVWREHQGETFIFPQSIRVFPIPSTEYLKYSDFEAENLVRHRKHA
jgi:hypothetical protein